MVYGFIVLRCTDVRYKVGHIIDWLFLPGKEAYASLLIDSALDCLREDDADIASCQTFRHDQFHQLLREKWFLNRGQAQRWNVNKVTQDLPPEIQDVQNWSLTPGDSDTI